MAKQRYISTSFRSDPYIENLDPSEKLLFLYFITNDHTDLCGIYEISIKKIGYDTGFDKTMVEKIIDRFSNDDRMHYMKGYIYIKNFIKYQSKNPSVEQGIIRSFKSLPQEILDGFGVDIDSSGKIIRKYQVECDNSTDCDRLGQTVVLNLTKPNLTKPNSTLPNHPTAVAVEQAPSFGNDDINKILDKIKMYNNGIADGTQKEQRQYGKMLLDKINKIESVKNGKYRPDDLLEIILRIVSENEYHSHKIVGPKKIYYELAALMQICKQDIQREDKGSIGVLPGI